MKGSTFCRVTIHWTTSDVRNVTRYILQVHPAATPCAGDGVSSAGECVVREGEGGFGSRELSLQLELGVEYEVTVSTVNCGTQAGNESDPIHILLHSKLNGSIETIILYSFDLYQFQMCHAVMLIHIIVMDLLSLLK